MSRIATICLMTLALVVAGQAVAVASSAGVVGYRGAVPKSKDGKSVDVQSASEDEDDSGSGLVWILAATGVAVTLGLVAGSGGSGSEAPKSP